MSSTETTNYIVKRRRTTTPRQKKVLAELVVNGGNMSKAMASAGYSMAYAKNSQKLTRCPSFKEALDMIQDDELLAKATEIALGDDKRACLVAIDMLLKLKDRYPAGKLKVQEYEEELVAIQQPPTVESAP